MNDGTATGLVSAEAMKREAQMLRDQAEERRWGAHMHTARLNKVIRVCCAALLAFCQACRALQLAVRSGQVRSGHVCTHVARSV